MECKFEDLTVGDLIKLCKEHDLNPDRTPVMYNEPTGNILTVLVSANVNNDIIELNPYPYC